MNIRIADATLEWLDSLDRSYCYGPDITRARADEGFLKRFYLEKTFPTFVKEASVGTTSASLLVSDMDAETVKTVIATTIELAGGIAVFSGMGTEMSAYPYETESPYIEIQFTVPRKA